MGVLRRMHQLPEPDRPREKLRRKGPAALSDFELLEVLIGNGGRSADVGTIARSVQKLLRKGGATLHYDKLTGIKGVSIATAGKLLAALELARRHLVRDAEPLRTQRDIVGRLEEFRTKRQEHFVCLTLDGGQRQIALRVITVGTLDAVIAHPREVFADAIADRAASVIVAHNHPSGEATPSQQDITLTQQLAAAGQLVGIPLHDHLILTRTDEFSFRQHHLL